MAVSARPFSPETLAERIERAFREIAYVAGELAAVRACGFSDRALHYPRSAEGLAALCAFNGITIERAPRGWSYWPNAEMKAAWERVIAALRAIANQQKDAPDADS